MCPNPPIRLGYALYIEVIAAPKSLPWQGSVLIEFVTYFLKYSFCFSFWSK